MSEKSPDRDLGNDGLPISPALELVIESAQVPPETKSINSRTLRICGLAILLGAAAALVAQALVTLINFVTNLAFFGRIALESASPADAVGTLGIWMIGIPVFGAIIIGVMARYGSKAIRGHGIPEAMEQILTNDSRIPARVTFLKPISSAIAIGTGGPFGAEGPIIATGGALGSVLGQMIHSTSEERKTLLAAGAAAGMAATFGSPVSAVLLAIELLLFEFRPRSIIPVALAASMAAGIRIGFEGHEPVFPMTDLEQPTSIALGFYILLGGFLGLISVLVTRAVYAIEDGFEKLPIHWMWWPAIGAVAVGIVGYIAPDTLGVGYYNISNILSDRLTVSTIVFLCGMKFISWSIALGSGTSGGTLAPLFTIGSGIGAVLGAGIVALAPTLGVDVRIAALVGMAAIFAGASRAMLASAVFAFETTLQPFGLLPLLGGCAAAYLVAATLMRNSIMTEKISRRGVRTPEDYEADILDQVVVREVMSQHVIQLNAESSLRATKDWLASHQEGTTHHGFPVVDQQQRLVGIVTRRDIFNPQLSEDCPVDQAVQGIPKFVYEDCSVRQAAEHMSNHAIGRLPVVTRDSPHRIVGMITRSDILKVFLRRVQAAQLQRPSLRLVPELSKRD